MIFNLYILLIVVPLAFGVWAQFRVSSALKTFGEIPASSRLSGSEVALTLLEGAGIRDVTIEEVNGMMGDHYDLSGKKLCLTSTIYHGRSIAALGVAAHECGHALQHQKNYVPLNLRMQIVPATQFASQILPFVIIGGFLFHMSGLITLGIACYALLIAFQLVTLPVEFDASHRAKALLLQMGFIQPGSEVAGVSAVLNAAALTYVAAFVAGLGNLLYLVMLRRDNNR
jgi:Zn-dependent membrane protease YugP